jgi:hypothetical protein
VGLRHENPVLGAGLVTRYTDESNYYYVTLRNSASGVVSLRRMRNGVFTELARKFRGVSANQPQHVRLESNGNRHMMFINEFLLLTAYDDSLPQGRAGLRSYRAA